MNAKERKEFKETLGIVKEICVICLLGAAFFSSCNSRKNTAEIVGNIANLQTVVEEVKEDIKTDQQDYYNEEY